MSETKTGYISIVGRTNVGKSTLLNNILDQKVSITSRKPQTTRHRLLGIKTLGNAQAVFVDTPGFHIGQKRALNRYMNKVAVTSMAGVDVLLFVIEAMKLNDEDRSLLTKIPDDIKDVILIINKVDRMADKDKLLPFIQEVSCLYNFSEIIPVSALKGTNVKSIEKTIFEKLPSGKHSYPKDQVADTTERFLASEVIREKCITRIGDEIPYRLSVMIDNFKTTKKLINIDATLYIEKNSQKGIVIGQDGKRLKAIGTAARIELEEILDTKIMLKLWVKVKSNWSDDEAMMSTMGYDLNK
jgi:GTP-binding protein Era